MTRFAKAAINSADNGGETALARRQKQDKRWQDQRHKSYTCAGKLF
jgi:hypothetical protein